MSAALRYAARRIVGGRAPQQQRQRLVHGGTPPSFPRVSTFATATRSNTKGLASESEGQIKKMKEELYTAITKHEKDNTIYDVLVSPNLRLLECLSVQLEPKHNDPRWKKDRRLAEDCRDIFSHYYDFENTVRLLDGSLGRATKRDLA